jgi:hypothetical protein
MLFDELECWIKPDLLRSKAGKRFPLKETLFLTALAKELELYSTLGLLVSERDILKKNLSLLRLFSSGLAAGFMDM